MKLHKKIIITLGIIFGMSLLFTPKQALAIDVYDDVCSGSNADTALCVNKDKDELAPMIKIIVNNLLYILGAVSVLVIIFSGISYTLSAGDANQVSKAKNTLMYAIVGLIVAILSYGIVNFVIDTIT